MRFRELLRFALRGLRRQKVRTLLTTVGVAVGACMLAFAASLGMGLRAMIDHEFRTRPGFWEVQVYPGTQPPPVPEDQIPAAALKVEGTFNAERTARIRAKLIDRYRSRNSLKPPAMLTDATIAELAALPGVADVVTSRLGSGWVYQGSKSAPVNVASGRGGKPLIQERLVAGRLPEAPASECAIAEMLLYDLGARSDAAFDATLGTTITLEFGEHRNERINRMAREITGAKSATPAQLSATAKLLEQIPTMIDQLTLSDDEKRSLKQLLAKAVPPAERDKTPTGTFTIVGIVRGPTESEKEVRGNYLVTWTTLFTDSPASEAMFRQLPHLRDGHYEAAEVKVQPGSDLTAVVTSIEALGFRTASAAEWFTSAKREVTLIGAGLNVFAIVSLLVAAIGITNTLVTSVVERTREIGILKAVGATGGQVRGIFLIEGTLIGLVGGILGLVLARLLAGPADEWVRQQVQALMSKRTLLTQSVFTFPYWLSLATPVFAMLITTLAALYPAHRAARIAPVEALRYG